MTATAALAADFLAGRAVTAELYASYVRDGITLSRRVLTVNEFAAVSAYLKTAPASPNVLANNVWD